MSKYSENLIVHHDGFSFYLNHFEDSLSSMKELKEFMLKWAQAEAQYAKSMGEVSKNVNKKAWKKIDTKEVGTFLNCFNVFNEEIEKIAKKHDEVSSRLAREIIPQMEALLKEGEKNVKKKLSTRAADLQKDYSENQKKLRKAKDDYYKACRESDMAREQYETKTKEGQVKPPVISKLKSTAAKKQSAAESCQAAYKKALEVMNSAQVKFYTKDMPALLDQFQSYDEDRTVFLKKVFQEAMDTLLTLPDFYQPLLQSMEESVKAIDEAQDICSFIEASKANCATVPDDIVYEPYVSDLAGSYGDLSDSKSDSKSDYSHSSLPTSPIAPSASATLTASTPGEIGVYRERPSVDPLKEYPGLLDSDRSLSPDAKAEKLRAQLSAIHTEIESQEKAKKGVESLFPLYQNDKVQLDSLKQGFEDVQRQIVQLHERRKFLEHLLSTVGGSASDIDSNSATAAANDEEEVEVSYAKALFDYNAAQDTELSFKQGDILVVIDQDSSGWWYAELDGNAGFAPKNYLKEISAEEAGVL